MMSDLISRHGVSVWLDNLGYSKLSDYVMDEDRFPSAESEPAIPLSWIEGQIKWLKSLDNAFSTLTAVQISAMVNKWRGEQNEID